MRTKLDLIVDYLADRSDGAAEPIRRELGEPLSETSLFLEGLRDRTRGMLELVPAERLAPKGGRRDPAIVYAHGPARKRLNLFPLAAAAAVIVAVGVAWRDQRDQIQKLETANARREVEWQSLIQKLETARAENAAKEKAAEIAAQQLRKLARAVEPAPRKPEGRDRVPELLLARLEAGLSKLDDRLNQTEGPPPPSRENAELDVDQLRRELEGLKQDTKTRDKAIGQDLKELRGTLEKVIMWVRQIASQPGLQSPIMFPVPVPVPVPSGPQQNEMNSGANLAPGLAPLLPYLGQTPQHHQQQQHHHQNGNEKSTKP